VEAMWYLVALLFWDCGHAGKQFAVDYHAAGAPLSCSLLPQSPDIHARARTAAEAAAVASTAEADLCLQQHSGATTGLPSEHLITEIQSKNVFSCSGRCGCDGCGGGSRPRPGARLHRRGAGGKLHHRRPGESLARARLA